MKRRTYRFGAVATVAVIAAALFVGGGPSAQSTPLPFTFYLTHVIKNRSGAVKRQGTWRATRFISFLQLPGWWGIENFREEGWQGPPGSASFSGFLKLRVRLAGRGSGVLRLWCLMPEVPKPRGHVGDGLSFTGRGLRFTDFRDQERSLEGVMFYSPGT